VINNYNATDGLMMKELPEKVMIQGVTKRLNNPPVVVVRKRIT